MGATFPSLNQTQFRRLSSWLFLAATSIILRDSAVDLIKASPLNLGSSPVFIAEVMALHHGIILALRNSIQHIIFEGDNLMVINSVTEKWAPPWQIAHIIRDILTLLKDISTWEICHIYREAKRAADWIANVGHLIDN